MTTLREQVNSALYAAAFMADGEKNTDIFDEVADAWLDHDGPRNREQERHVLGKSGSLATSASDRGTSL